MPFKPGNKLAKGGARQNSGPPKEDIKLKFQAMLHRSDAHLRFEKMLTEETDKELWLRAYQLSLNRAYGKEEQPIKPVDDQGNYAPFHVYLPAQVSGQEGTSK